MGTAKLRKLDTSRVLTPGELEVLNKNFFDIEAALNSVGAATPGSVPVIPPGLLISSHHSLTDLTAYDDHTQYLFLASRTGGQILSENSFTIQSLNTTLPNNPFFVVKSGFLNTAAHTQLHYLDSAGTKIAQIGVDVTSPLTNLKSALTLGPVTGGLTPYLILGADQVFNQGSLFVNRSGYLEFTQILGRGVLNWRGWNGTNYSTGLDIRLLASHRGFSFIPNFHSGVMIVFGDGLSQADYCFTRFLFTNSAPPFTYTNTGFFDILQAGGSTTEPVLTVRGRQSATGDLQQWFEFTGGSATVAAKIDKDGKFTAVSLTGPLTTLTTRGDLLTRDASSQIRLPIGSSGKYLKSDGTDPSWQTIALSDLSGISHLVYDNAGMTLTGATWALDTDLGGIIEAKSLFPDVNGFPLFFVDSTTGFSLYFTTSGPITATNSLILPLAGGEIITSLGTGQILGGGKIGAVDMILRATTIGSGVRFQDTTTASKILRFILSTAVGSNAIALRNTLARTYTFPDYEGDVVIFGNQASSAGKLGSSNLSAQTVSTGAITLLTSSANSVGLYRVSVYFKTTTAGAAGDTVKCTVTFNDGSAQTVDIPLNPIAAAAPALSQTHDLATLNKSSYGEVIVYSAASNAITAAHTVAKTGSPEYTAKLRIEFLGNLP